MSTHINIPGTNTIELNLTSPIDVNPDPDEVVFPSAEFNSVFSNNELSALEKTITQVLTAEVVNMNATELYHFKLFNTLEEGGDPAVFKVGFTTTANVIQETITPAELALITNINCRAELVFPDLDLTYTVNFTSDLGQAPDLPVVEDQIVSSLRPTLAFGATLRSGDSVRAEIDGATYAASSFEGYRNLSFNVTKDLTDSQVYTLTIIVTGQDAQTSSASADVTVNANDTSKIKVLTPPQPFVSSGDSLEVTWENANPLQHATWVEWYREGGSATESFRTLPADGTSFTLRNLPTDGSEYKIKVIQIGDNGSGEPDWQDRDEFILDGVSQPQPSITSPADGAVISNPQNVSFGIAGAAPGDAYNFKVSTRFNFDGQYVIQDNSGITASSQTINNAPNDGSSLYISLETIIAGAAVAKDVIHFVSGDTGGVSNPTILTPVQVSDLVGTGAEVSWAPNGQNPVQWWLHAGTFSGGEDLYNSGSIPNPGATSHTIPQGVLPNDGSIVYLKLSLNPSGNIWKNVIICFTSGTSSKENRPVISAPAASSVVQGSTIAASWAEGSAFDADFFRLRAGSTEEGTEYGDWPSIPVSVLNQEIDGYNVDGPVHVTLSSLIGGSETIHSKKAYQHQIIQLGGHGINQGAGIYRSTAGMEEITLPVHISNDNNVRLENKIIRLVDNGTGGLGQNGAVTFFNCNYTVVKNCVIICPPEWYRDVRNLPGGGNDFRNEGLALVFKGGHSNTVEETTTIGGAKGIWPYRQRGFKMRAVTCVHSFSHHIIFNEAEAFNGRGTDVDGFHCYSRYDAVRNTGSMDCINFYNTIKHPNISGQHIFKNYLSQGGNGPNGSGGGIIDGYDSRGVPGGGITYQDGVTLDGMNKPFSIAHGGRNKLIRLWGLQDSISPSRFNSINKGGGYVGDFRNANDRGIPDLEFGNHEVTDCITHWRDREDIVRPFRGDRVISIFHPHPRPFTTYTGNQWDDTEYGRKNFEGEGTINRASTLARGLGLVANNVAHDLPETRNMGWANHGL